MIELLINRRSVRSFKETPIERKKVETLIKAALLSPSSKNKRPWEFIIVDDKKMLERLSKSKTNGSTFLKNAPMAFVVVADSEVSDVWVEDASIASITLQYTAETLNLGSCWVQIRNRTNEKGASEQYVQQLLNIPKNKQVESIIAIGYPDEKKKTYSEDQLLYEKIYKGRYGERYR
ncbi:nitroreductase family protein [Proteinivorax tanatarense]|uniref:Nitroreductase family protein n=1 Tax=Proteinivorax tanatarense TaxID=1260629 RepID=A0AAU7VSN6_9FIRM